MLLYNFISNLDFKIMWMFHICRCRYPVHLQYLQCHGIPLYSFRNCASHSHSASLKPLSHLIITASFHSFSIYSNLYARSSQLKSLTCSLHIQRQQLTLLITCGISNNAAQNAAQQCTLHVEGKYFT